MLESLGLSRNQAKAYLALSQLGRAKAGEIYKYASISRQDIYRVLEKLQKIGLIGKIVSCPNEYVAIPFSDGLTMLVQHKRAEFEEIAKKVEKIKENVLCPKLSEEFLQEQIMAIAEYELLTFKIKKAFKTAMHSIEFVCNWHAFVHGTMEVLEDAKETLRKGVKGRTLVERPKNSLAVPKFIQKLVQDHLLEIRIIDSIPFTSLGIIDKNEIAFAPLHQKTQLVVYWTKNRGLVHLANNYFENMWNKADPLWQTSG